MERRKIYFWAFSENSESFRMKLICSLLLTCLRFSSRIKSCWELLINKFKETVLFIFSGLICSSCSMHYKTVPISLSLDFSLVFPLCLLLSLVHTKVFSFYISSGFRAIFILMSSNNKMLGDHSMSSLGTVCPSGDSVN